MQNDSSTTSFFKKLAEKDRQKSALLYAKGKQNFNNQASHQPPLKKNKRTKTQTSLIHPAQSSVENNWFLDCRTVKVVANNSLNIFDKWLAMPSGIIQFSRIIQNGNLDQQFKIVNTNTQANEDNRKSLIVQIWIANSNQNCEFMQTFIDYALPLLKIGKGVWSVAAITHNKRYDLLSLDSEGSPLWKGKTPLSKVQLERENLMKRVFGFSIEKERQIGVHQTLAKVQFPNYNSTIYFIMRNPHFQATSNAQLLIQQQIFIQNITNIHRFSILRLEQAIFYDQLLAQILKKLNLKVKKEEQLSKNERQRFLKSMIDKLQGDLQGKQEELKIYKSQKQEQEVQQDFGIPSQRISMNQQRYMQLKRQIKQIKSKDELL